MDPLRILVRVVFGYVVLLVLVRLSGKRAVKQSNPFDFTLALILGDMVDDLVWAEVPAAAFVVAASVLMTVHLAMDMVKCRLRTTR